MIDVLCLAAGVSWLVGSIAALMGWVLDELPGDTPEARAALALLLFVFAPVIIPTLMLVGVVGGVHYLAASEAADREGAQVMGLADLVAENAASPAKKKRKKTKSPTARTLEECRKRGWIAQVVERTIPHSFIKQDLFGCIDVVAITPVGILGIQATSNSNHADRRKKIHAEPRMQAWIGAGAQLAIWSWAKQGARDKAKRWTLREERVELADFAAAEASAA